MADVTPEKPKRWLNTLMWYIIVPRNWAWPVPQCKDKVSVDDARDGISLDEVGVEWFTGIEAIYHDGYLAIKSFYSGCVRKEDDDIRCTECKGIPYGLCHTNPKDTVKEGEALIRARKEQHDDHDTSK